jgi:hypothetical protein
MLYIKVIGNANTGDKAMTNLMTLYKKLLAAQEKLAEAQQYSDWRRSVGAYKAAETKANQKLLEGCRKYLGQGYTQQDLINLLNKLQGAA